MTPEKLIANATQKGYKVNLETSPEFIGIAFRKNATRYHWFKINHKFNEVEFHHTYSMNTGKSFKGLYHGMNIKEKLGFYDVIMFCDGII